MMRGKLVGTRAKALLVLSAAVALSTTLSGCDYGRTRHHAVSVVDYLYPDAEAPIVSPGVPVLSLPVRVGVAFVPSSGGWHSGSLALTEREKTELLEVVAEHFEQYDFVDTIEVIPTSYLRPRGSFANLEQVRRLFDVDLMALVSYDQVQFTEEGFLSLTYWTLVGAYVVPGEKNDTHTLLDTAVYDVASRKLLFRAPGTAQVRGRATPVGLEDQLREDRAEGFERATLEMTANLDLELSHFKERVRAEPTGYRVEKRAGYTGAGSLDPWTLVLVAALAGGAALSSRRRRAGRERRAA